MISDNCNGGCILHDLGVKFNSPFINLWIAPNDYIHMLQNLNYYLSPNVSIEFMENAEYPIGVLGGNVKIHFLHYKSNEEAYQKWKLRSSRINWGNLFIIFSDRNDCTLQNLIDFDKLPYENKVVFTHISYPEISSAQKIRGFESERQVGILLEYKSKWTWKKYYDCFDYVSWFNSGKIENKGTVTLQ